MIFNAVDESSQVIALEGESYSYSDLGYDVSAQEYYLVPDQNDEDVSDPSDIALKDGQVYVLGDHENDEPVPPLSVFDIVEYD